MKTEEFGYFLDACSLSHTLSRSLSFLSLSHKALLHVSPWQVDFRNFFEQLLNIRQVLLVIGGGPGSLPLYNPVGLVTCYSYFNGLESRGFQLMWYLSSFLYDLSFPLYCEDLARAFNTRSNTRILKKMQIFFQCNFLKLAGEVS